MFKYLTTTILTVLVLLSSIVTSNAAVEDLRTSDIWMVDKSAMETFYSGIANNEELTMECYNGTYKFGYFNKATSDEENSNDTEVTIYIDGTPFPYPLDDLQKENFYDALRTAKHTIQYAFANGVESSHLNVKGLSVLISQTPFDLSNCQ